jgi:nitrogen fixation/metabolism regulation signal transduction histidine kinase
MWTAFTNVLPYLVCLVLALNFSALAAPLAVTSDAAKTGDWVWKYAVLKAVGVLFLLGMLTVMLSIPAATTGREDEHRRVMFVIADALGGLGVLAAMLVPIMAAKYLQATQAKWFGYFSTNGKMALSVYALMAAATVLVSFVLVQVKLGW